MLGRKTKRIQYKYELEIGNPGLLICQKKMVVWYLCRWLHQIVTLVSKWLVTLSSRTNNETIVVLCIYAIGNKLEQKANVTLPL
jgi:hypothetical protein